MTRLGSHHSEKMEFLRQILRKKPTFVIGNSNQPSHVKTTLTRPRKGSNLFSSIGGITVDPKGVAKLLDGLNVYKASGPDELNTRVLKECGNEISPVLALIYNESLARAMYQMIGDKQMFLQSLKRMKSTMLLITGRFCSHASAANPESIF